MSIFSKAAPAIGWIALVTVGALAATGCGAVRLPRSIRYVVT
jgi:hypothetical protein